MIQLNVLQPVTLALQEQYCASYNKTPVLSADCTFTNVFAWADIYKLSFLFENDICWIKNEKDDLWWTCVGDWSAQNWAESSVLQAGGTFTRVPEALAQQWQIALGQTALGEDKVIIEEARDQWEYLYTASDLVFLKGNRFHKKKNHVNGFFKAYNAEYHVVTPTNIKDVLALQKEWCEWNECENSPALIAENDAILKVLHTWDDIHGLCGGILCVDDEIVAYTIGEIIDKTLVVHFEKARTDYRGAYQAINQQFVHAVAQDLDLVNREQDLGDAGLRKAKESYNPIDYLKKVTVTIKA